MATYLVFNTTETTLSNVNAGGIDVPPRSIRSAVLTDTELGVAATLAGVFVGKSTATLAERRRLARLAKYSVSATGAAL